MRTPIKSKDLCDACKYGWVLWEGNEVNITPWQPLPEPPKGE